MSVLALEPNRSQADGIRQACSLAGTSITVVENVGDLLAAMQAHPPTVVLLPALVTAVDEAAVVEFLRSSPQYPHVEVLVTPMLAAPGGLSEASGRSWLRRSTRRPTAPVIAADASAFAESLRWSLERVRQRRLAEAVETEAAPLVGGGAEQEIGAPPSLLGILGDVIAETGHDLHELRLEDATTRLLQKLQDDRRSHRRFPAGELRGLREARIRFGPPVALVDVSAGGALLESETRLQPDTEALLELARGDGKIVVPFRVLRSHVAALNGAPRYRGACAFKSPLDIDDLLIGAGMTEGTMALVAPPHLQVCNAW